VSPPHRAPDVNTAQPPPPSRLVGNDNYVRPTPHITYRILLSKTRVSVYWDRKWRRDPLRARRTMAVYPTHLYIYIYIYMYTPCGRPDRYYIIVMTRRRSTCVTRICNTYVDRIRVKRVSRRNAMKPIRFSKYLQTKITATRAVRKFVSDRWQMIGLYKILTFGCVCESCKQLGASATADCVYNANTYNRHVIMLLYWARKKYVPCSLCVACMDKNRISCGRVQTKNNKTRARVYDNGRYCEFIPIDSVAKNVFDESYEVSRACNNGGFRFCSSIRV